MQQLVLEQQERTDRLPQLGRREPEPVLERVLVRLVQPEQTDPLPQQVLERVPEQRELGPERQAFLERTDHQPDQPSASLH